jgi:PPOX class probable FMN-dependent enzyme
MAEDALATTEALREMYGAVHPLAAEKVMARLDRHCRAFIELSPFLVLGTADEQGNQDVSPRGDPPGFVRVLDDRTLAIPDRPGNRRVDSLGNIVRHPKVALLFMVPGMQETLRVNGRARLSIDPELLKSLAVNGRPAVSALVVEVEEAFLHCGKAVIRSHLWDPGRHVPKGRLPSLARMIADQIEGTSEAENARAIDQDYTQNLY